MAGRSGTSLTRKHEEAIAALLTYTTVKQAADAVQIGERTLHRWLAEDEEFIAAYRQARKIVFAHAIAQAQRLLPLAINVLGQIMADTKVPATARVAAATAVTKFGRESIELDDLAGRLEALEASARAAALEGRGQAA